MIHDHYNKDDCSNPETESILLQNTRAVSVDEIAARVAMPGGPNQLPKIVMSIGPCRSGTTVFLRVFAASGIRSSGKPLKVLLRWLLQEPDERLTHTWTFPLVPIVYLKESIGPYSRAESEFDPLKVLLVAIQREGLNESEAIEVMRQKVRILVTGREPMHSWVSWIAKYGAFVQRETLFRNFVLAHETVARVSAMASDWGLRTFHYVLEAHMVAELATSSLFAALDILEKPVIKGWKSLPSFPSDESGIEIPEQPSVYDRTGRFDKILNSDGLRYFRKTDTELAAILQNEEQDIRNKVVPVYEVWRTKTEADLGIILPREERK